MTDKGAFEAFGWFARIFAMLDIAGVEMESSEPYIEAINAALGAIIADVEATQQLNNEPMILAGCPADGIVLDPFFGSGTTGLVARKHGRRYLGSELNPEYVAIARERLRLPFEERHVKQETAIDDLPLFAGLTA